MAIKFLDEEPIVERSGRIRFIDTPTTIEKKPTETRRGLFGLEKTEKRISERTQAPGAWERLEKETAQPWQWQKHPVKTAISATHRIPVTGLKAIGLAAERIEAAIANPLMKIQETDLEEAGWISKIPATEIVKNPELNKKLANLRFKFAQELGQETWKGLTGKRKGELGDLPRRVGVPEPLSAAIGFFSLMGIANVVTKGKLVSSAKTAERIVKSKLPRAMGKNYALDRSKLAAKGLDDLYEGVSKEYDDVFKKIADRPVNLERVQEVIDDLPQMVVNKISKSKLITKLSDGTMQPNLNNLKIIKNIISRTIPKKVLNGSQDADMFQGNMKYNLSKIRQIMVEGNPELQAINKTYAKFMKMNNVVKGVLYNKGKGIVVSKKLINLFKKSGERGEQIYFEKFASQWTQASQIMKDIIKFNRRQAFKKGTLRAARWIGIGSGGALGVRKVFGGGGSGGSYGE